MNMRHFSFRSLAFLLFLSSASFFALQTSSFAQDVATKTLHLLPGETVEIGTDSLAQNAQYSWVLTKDRQFLVAQRTRFFRTRLTEPGTYVLDISVQDPVNAINEYHAFTLIVDDQPLGFPPLPPASSDETPLSAMLTTNPPLVNGAINLPKEGGFLRIDPLASQGKISNYDLDLNLSFDSDRDGKPANDRDTDGTISSLSGTPIYVYTLPSGVDRSLALTVRSVRSLVSSTIRAALRFSGIRDIPSNLPSSPQNSAHPFLVEQNGLLARFSLLLPEELKQKQLLFEWDFGDTTKSLLTSPQHTYFAAGSYPVSVTVRDILTGTSLLSFTDSVTLTESSASLSSSTSSSVSASVQSSSGSSASEVSFWWTSFFPVFLILLALLFLSLLLFFFIQFIKRKMGEKLSMTLETIENKIVSSPSRDALVTTIEPVKLKKETPPQKEVIVSPKKESSSQDIAEKETSNPEFSSQRTNETPLTQSGPVPSWLQKGASPSKTSETHSAIETPKTPPVPSNAVPMTPSTPSPSPSPSSSASSTPSPSSPVPPLSVDASPASEGNTGPVPAWLKTSPSATPVASKPIVPPVSSPLPTPKLAQNTQNNTPTQNTSPSQENVKNAPPLANLSSSLQAKPSTQASLPQEKKPSPTVAPLPKPQNPPSVSSAAPKQEPSPQKTENPVINRDKISPVPSKPSFPTPPRTDAPKNGDMKKVNPPQASSLPKEKSVPSSPVFPKADSVQKEIAVPAPQKKEEAPPSRPLVTDAPSSQSIQKEEQVPPAVQSDVPPPTVPVREEVLPTSLELKKDPPQDEKIIVPSPVLPPQENAPTTPPPLVDANDDRPVAFLRMEDTL
jgi:hypothetical protein